MDSLAREVVRDGWLDDAIPPPSSSYAASHFCCDQLDAPLKLEVRAGTDNDTAMNQVSIERLGALLWSNFERLSTPAVDRRIDRRGVHAQAVRFT